jgi:hypothetical protein
VAGGPFGDGCLKPQPHAMPRKIGPAIDGDNPEWTEADFARAKTGEDNPAHIRATFPNTVRIHLIGVMVARDQILNLTFSDGATARWSAETLIARDTVLTRPLTDSAYFARAFIEAGALAWPNGLELSPMALHRRLDEAGALMRKAA